MSAVVGLDLGTSAVRAAQLSRGRGGTILERVGQVPLPYGAMREGEIVQPDVVAEAVRMLWQNFGFKSRKVALGLANQQVVVRQVDLPYLPPDELRQSLSFQVQDYLPIPVEQAVLDLHVLDVLETDEGRRTSRVLLVAAQKTMVDEFVDVARRAKLDPIGLDLHAFALLRALADPEFVAEGQGELLLDIGASVTNLVVHDHGTPRFVRMLSAGGAGITDSLVAMLGMTADEAEQAKATIGVPTDRMFAFENDEARIITERATRFVEEVRSSVDYYRTQKESVPLNRVLVAGGASLLPNLRERLAEVLGLPVEQGRPLDRLTLGKVGLVDEQLEQAEPFVSVAVGLALGALQ